MLDFYTKNARGNSNFGKIINQKFSERAHTLIESVKDKIVI